jgi:hypothetical protein
MKEYKTAEEILKTSFCVWMDARPEVIAEEWPLVKEDGDNFIFHAMEEYVHQFKTSLEERDKLIRELVEQLRGYVLAQSRMLDKYSEGDENIKTELWKALHSLEDDARATLESAKPFISK